MEDVIQNYLKAKRDLASGASAKTMATGEPVSWSYPESMNAAGTDSEILRRTTLPYPLSGLFFLVDGHKQYPESCHQLAEFLKTQCGQFPLEIVLQQAFQARFPRVWMERFLFIILEVQASDWQTAAYVLQFRHLKRLLLRVERHKPLNPVETTMAGEIIQTLGLSRYTDLEPFCRHACDIFKFMQSGRIPVSGDLGLLIYLIRCESVSMRERKNWLESDLASGDPESVAKMTPLLKHLEERMEKAQEMAERLGSYGPILNAPMGLEEAMGPFFFGHLRESLAKLPELAFFKETLELQQAKRVPTRDLIALTSLCRWLMEARGLSVGPLDWVRMALEAYDHGRFRINIAGGLPAVEALLSEVKVDREGTLITGDFGENPYFSWIARDGLTRPFRSANPNRISPDLRPVVLANLHRDNIILKLIDHPKVYQSPGLIEAIVAGSHSVQVHVAIASRRELHTGSVNGRVPLALLRSPVDIAPELLRPLVHPQHISFTDLKSLYRAREALRPAVVQELHAFLNQAYSL